MSHTAARAYARVLDTLSEALESTSTNHKTGEVTVTFRFASGGVPKFIQDCSSEPRLVQRDAPVTELFTNVPLGQTAAMVLVNSGVPTVRSLLELSEARLRDRPYLVGPLMIATIKKALDRQGWKLAPDNLPVDAVLDMSVHDFLEGREHGVRIANCLTANGIHTVRDITKRDWAEVQKGPNMGPRMTQVLRERLRSVGLDFNVKE
jgi:hypothetical protein